MLRRIKRKGGFLLSEVVIALAVIVIVSVAALTISLSSISAKFVTVNQSRAIGFADNTLECFKASDTGEEFISYVEFAEGIVLTDGQTDGDGNTVYTYSSEKNSFTATLTVNFEDTRPTLSINVISDKNGKEIISFSYTKGGVI